MKKPNNLIFWKMTLKEDKIQPFLDRGLKDQKKTIKNVLKYLKNMEPEFFEQVEGKQILKQLKKGELK